MKPKMKVKLLIDLLMTACLLLLMAYQVVGDVLHEWFGAAMLVLFVAHTALNLKWYKTLFKGKYTPLRALGAAVNLAVLAAIVCLGYSGIVMSRHLFAFLPIDRGMAAARVIHLLASYWGFVMMSVHLGLHWGMIMSMTKRALHIKMSGKAASISSKAAALSLSAYGIYAFVTERIAMYLFLRTEFVAFDYEASAISVFSKYIAMMALFMTIAYYAARLLRKLSDKDKESA